MMRRKSTHERFLVLSCMLAFAGLLICLMLLQAYAGGSLAFCPRNLRCEAVLTSRYSMVWGVPLPWFGAAFYSGILAMLTVALATKPAPWRMRLLQVALWLVVAGLSFSAALMYVQFAVLHAFCVLCTASAVVLLALVLALAKTVRSPTDQVHGNHFGAAMVAVIATFAFGMHFPWDHVLENGITGGQLKFGAVQAVSIDLAYAEILGPKDAKVELIVFSDFTCKFCIQFAETLKKIRAEFPNEVRIAYLAFPQADKGPAFSAAVAARCAAEQGAYWPYHDRLFAERGELTDARLLSIAAEAGLNQERFTECFRSDRARKKVEAGLQDASRSGIKGVPTIFLNGARISSVVDYPTLERQIKIALQKDAATRGEHPSPSEN
jgi:protein-disulfide isomerase/uncharacterized membrane protein